MALSKNTGTHHKFSLCRVPVQTSTLVAAEATGWEGATAWEGVMAWEGGTGWEGVTEWGGHLLLPELGDLRPGENFISVHGDILVSVLRPGDWKCKECENVNFAWRDKCNKCEEPKVDRGTVAQSPGLTHLYTCTLHNAHTTVHKPIHRYKYLYTYTQAWSNPSTCAHLHPAPQGDAQPIAPRPGSATTAGPYGRQGPEARPGDWDCPRWV